MHTLLERRGLAINESTVVNDKEGYICRKCLRGFEAFQTSKEKLLLSADTALRYIPTRPKAECCRKRTLDEDSDVAQDLVAPAKRPRIAHPTGQSPSVQVRS